MALRSSFTKINQLIKEYEQLLNLKRLRQLEREIEEPLKKEFYKFYAKCAHCGLEVACDAHAIFSRHGIKEVGLVAAEKCGCGPKRKDSHLDYLELHPKHS